ncbi:THUMP-like domain-containing protein [Luteibaculum oceani]|uniref:THUMP-like domain-containing protein n=1 Tax=Luteibaculum oceani TaxID=1294296 RepID=A0A5C6V8S6_9FLAO|nr:hypothetical protein [Luteibaculum oceani]TXC81813.1 hypothetical protein FRX97_04655 [Luteibaculum oceani]
MNEFITQHNNLWNHLSNQEVIDWYEVVSEKELNHLLLSGKEMFDLPPKLLVQQVKSYRKIKSKAPGLDFSRGLVFPDKNNVEQCSSEFTAKFKTQFLADLEVENIVDVTGGWGIDVIYFSESIPKVTHIEIDAALQKIAQYNFQKLGLEIDSSSSDYRDKPPSFYKNKWVYADPMRREGHNRILGWEGQSPNPKALIDWVIHRNCLGLMLKLSPMDDLTWVREQLPENCGSCFLVLEVGTELKEVLLVITMEQKAKLQNRIVFIQRPNGTIHSYSQNEIEQTQITPSASRFIYVPRPALNKMGWAKLMPNLTEAEDLGSDLWMTNAELNTQAFRKFEVIEEVPSTIKKLKKRFGKSDLHVISKGFGLSADQIQSQLSLRPKGENFLIFTGYQGKRKVFLAKSS